MDLQKKEDPKNKGKNKKKNKKENKRKIAKRILIGLLILCICVTAGAIGVVYAIVQSAPALPTGDLLDELTQSSKIFDSDGNYVEDISSSDKRHILFLNEIPENLQDAFIAIEDQRFEKHNGIDVKRIFGALLNNIKTLSKSQGASTITQQLVKNILLTQERTFERKIQEMYISINLERKYDKNEILEAYLNTVWMGGNNYGVEAGAQYFFGKSATELNLAECALLAGINQNAALHDPYNKNKISGMKKRLSSMLEEGTITQEEHDSTAESISTVFAKLLESQDYEAYKTDIAPIIEFMKSKDPVINGSDASAKASRETYYDNLTRFTYKERQHATLSAMLKLGSITQEEYDEAVNYKLVLKGRDTFNAGTKYQWFIEPAVDQIVEDYAKQYNVDTSEASRIIRTGGYSIHLTMDKDIQDAAEKAINTSSHYPSGYKNYAVNAEDDPLPQPQAATVVTETSTGKVIAVVGGRGEQPERSYNRATDPEVARQPGSSIKPLAVYTPALEEGIATAGTVVEDSPLTEEQVKASNNWDPRNYDGKFRGYVTVRDAVRQSLNTVAVKLQLKVGASTSIKYLTDKFHLSTIATSTSSKANDRNAASLALGGLTYGVTPLEMTAAYATLGNSGVYSEPIYYTQVVDKYGNVVLEKKTSQSKEISEQAAYVMTNMLETVVKSGTGTKASLGSQPAAGKTGTTDDHTNGWYVGYTPYYSCAVWIGHDDKSVAIKGLVGGTGAPIWKAIMKTAHNGLPVKSFTQPSGITKAQVCIDSGNSPIDLCSLDQRGSRVTTEIFIKGTEPVQLCNVHVGADIDSSTGLLATEFCPSEFIINKIFITRATKSRAALGDDAYVLPTVYCTSHTHPVTPNPTPTLTPTPDDGDDDGDDDNGGPKPTKPEKPTPSTPTTPTTPSVEATPTTGHN